MLDSGIVVAQVSSPSGLEVEVLHALERLPRARTGDVPVGRVWQIPAQTVEFTGREEFVVGIAAALVSGGPAVVQAVHGIGGVGKTTAAVG